MAENGQSGIPSRQRNAGGDRSSFGNLSFSWEVHLTPNPIRKVLSTIRKHNVQALLMGGQACVFYGAAEFSRDIDFALFSRAENLMALQEALRELEADVIEVPPFDEAYLRKGHAVHFRCRTPEAEGLRIDVMTIMRKVDDFPTLWDRRTTLETDDGEIIDLMSLQDLVQAKKTQRDKDWPMIKRLLEAHYAQFRHSPNDERHRFWLNELRTPVLLWEARCLCPVPLPELKTSRRWLENLETFSEALIEEHLAVEEKAEREADRLYWVPLKKELEELRRAIRAHG